MLRFFEGFEKSATTSAYARKAALAAKTKWIGAASKHGVNSEQAEKLRRSLDKASKLKD
jgi:hypothetical protein